MHAQWDSAFLIVLIGAVAIGGLAVLTGIGAIIVSVVTKGDHGIGVMLGAGVVVVLMGVAVVGDLLPFGTQYHQFVPKTGQVAKVGSRFLASDTQGGGTTQKYVVTFRDGRSYGCLDTRCANVSVGDRLSLLCERVFQFNAPAEGWDCNWGRDVKPNGHVIP